MYILENSCKFLHILAYYCISLHILSLSCFFLHFRAYLSSLHALLFTHFGGTQAAWTNPSPCSTVNLNFVLVNVSFQITMLPTEEMFVCATGGVAVQSQPEVAGLVDENLNQDSDIYPAKVAEAVRSWRSAAPSVCSRSSVWRRLSTYV